MTDPIDEPFTTGQEPDANHLRIVGPGDVGLLVDLDMATGEMIFGPNYTPTAAAEAFWSALNDEYRHFLAWKAERS